MEKGKHVKVKVIICGGDGTVLWVVQLLAEQGINTSFISFGVIPIGTGNDFSRSLGWGGTPLTIRHDHLDPLKRRIVQWLEAE
jgi:diacylglycerol kinase (ATP)